MEPQYKQNKFDLSNFLIDSLSLHVNLSPHTITQNKNDDKDPIDEFVKRHPREILGFNSFGKPRQVAESTVGTPIQEFYRGMNILVTGGSGFIGKVLIEKLIRSVPHLNQIYVLLRGKKGVSAKDRFEKLLEDEVFLRMKTEVPDYRSKLTLVEGDICEAELGLSETDRQTLQSRIHIVFHSAADVRFVNPLRAAIQTNLIGSKRLIELAKGMINLKSYVHVSTAFSNCVNRKIDERIYTPAVQYQEILQLLKEKSDDEIKKDEERILLGWPNTYTFSKALCEDMISQEAKDLPICIFRPSIVGPTNREPLRGWTDNIYGPVGVFMAVGLGVIHVFSADDSLPADWVPADFAVNIMITACWENATSRINAMPVYNFSTSPRNPYSWGKIGSILTKYLDYHTFQQAIWHSSVIHPSHQGFLEKLGIAVLHEIPGYLLDWVAVTTGKKPRLTKLYKRLALLKDKLDYFVFGIWEIQNGNTIQLMNKLSNEDKKLFPSDLSEMNIEEYFLVCRLGVKYFYLKENIDDTADADRKALWLKVAHRSLQFVSALAALKLMVGLAHVVPL